MLMDLCRIAPHCPAIIGIVPLKFISGVCFPLHSPFSQTMLFSSTWCSQSPAQSRRWTKMAQGAAGHIVTTMTAGCFFHPGNLPALPRSVVSKWSFVALPSLLKDSADVSMEIKMSAGLLASFLLFPGSLRMPGSP